MVHHTRVHEAHQTTLGDYLRVVRRRKWIILQALVLVPAAAVAFSLHQPKLFQASSEVLLSRQNLAASLTGTQDTTASQQADRLAQTQADLARVPEVALRTLNRVGLQARTPEQFLASSSSDCETELRPAPAQRHRPQSGACLPTRHRVREVVRGLPKTARHRLAANGAPRTA